MPRLKCTFRRFLEIIAANGFELHRHGATSHRRYRRELNGTVYFVDVAYHRIDDVILDKTLASMIRQTGLSKSLFRQ